MRLLRTLCQAHNSSLCLCSLPGGWRLPVKLRELRLSRNRLAGDITGVSFPSGLRKLYLDGQLSDGKLSGSVGQLPPSLETLSLYSNAFVAVNFSAIPDTVRSIQLHDNRIAGGLGALTLPPQLGQLRLENNLLSGPLPRGWRIPNTTTSLSLASNQLTGSIPGDMVLSPATSLEFTLFNNSLTGRSILSPPQPSAACSCICVFVLAGALPDYPGLTNVNFTVQPGNQGLCGTVSLNAKQA